MPREDDSTPMRIPVFFLVLAVAACTAGSEPEPTPTAVSPDTSTTSPTTGTPELSTSTTSASPDTTTTLTTQPPEGDSGWPDDPPDRYAVAGEEQIAVVESEERSSVEGLEGSPVAAGFVEDRLFFSVGCCDGIWVWDFTQAGEEEPVQVVSGESAERVVELHGVTDSGTRRGFFYTERSDEPDGGPQQMMFYDTATGESEVFLELVTRRPDLSGEEETAPVGAVSAGLDRIVMLFSVGDHTWLEWYDHQGQPDEGPSQPGDGDTILDVSMSGDSFVIGTERSLHAGITDISVVDHDGETIDTFSIPEDQSLRDLDYDGRWVSGSLHENTGDTPGETDPIGTHVIDTDTGDAGTLDQIGTLVLAD